MKHGVTILTDQPWAQSRPLWQAAEEMGFDHAWTYDHLVWGGLPNSPWLAGIPTLTAAAGVTSRIQLGTAVCAPNFRHPFALLREVQAVQDISGGRFVLGVGTGGDLDSRVLGQAPMTVRERVDRFQEFTGQLLRLRDEDHVTEQGRWFSLNDARTLPSAAGLPVVVSANGPRSVRYAARVGDGWMTLGPAASTVDEWFTGLTGQTKILEEALDQAGRDIPGFRRFLMLDAPHNRAEVPFSLSSADFYDDVTGRAAELGFTDVITHWPRAGSPYQGDVKVLEEVAARLAG
ncbi:LLM class flavin-dependent oxidoreductase [Kineosporia succinea]|uniref:Alkanesulfonate monooxygenase SsuD/methylene tetrahydromethanopterin reductase-like flavin-dependent oxidoreductase (Luciferase family) n=1 Tax=Kineosporia succinea TaxID=84632 RepID=A0ABT9P904_9ACTN|nr:LLM class flavin-dependent oxidoreductase [Kineosporia succinea]MDP9829182.1 alkanesulfonate monooxygenase SsuD/methylene tetrahydromethanopterin reductase-like flavin-dependent oxidoreductase (luciferase family) [Kineosporia succinea]